MRLIRFCPPSQEVAGNPVRGRLPEVPDGERIEVGLGVENLLEARHQPDLQAEKVCSRIGSRCI